LRNEQVESNRQASPFTRAARSTAKLLLFASLAWQTLSGAAFAAGQREPVDMTLEELSNLVVTSVSRRPESLAETPSAVQVITGEEIRRSGATSIPEALRLASNLQVAQISSNNWAISARGFNSVLANKLLVMIDGRTIYSPLFAGTFWEAQDVPLYDVDRIEVISGPGGTLWGANAVNGVINIVTRSAADTQGLLVRAGGGNELQGDGAIRYGGTAGTTSYRVYGQYAERDATERPSGADGLNGSHVGQAGFRLDWASGGGDLLTLQGDANEVHTDSPATSDPTSRSQNLLARWRRQFSGTSELQVQMYYDRELRHVPNSYGDDLQTLDIELQHHFQAGARHDIVWGLTYRAEHDDFDNDVYALDPPRITLHRPGGFIQDDIALLPNTLHLTIGTKLEDNEFTGAEWQPSARLAWRFSPDSLLWGAVSRAVRTPSRVDRDLANRTRPPFTVGNDDFESEKLIAYELGLRTQPVRPLSIALATYYNDYDDLRSFEPPPGQAFPLIFSNQLAGETYGAELTAEYQPGTRWRLSGGYTYLHIDLHLKPGSRDPLGGTLDSRDWNHQVFLRGAVTLPGNVELDGTLRRIGELTNQRVPAYTEMDLRAGWHVTPELDLSLNGHNLLHDSHGEFGPLEFGPPGRQLIERSVYAFITWQR
jgi:iron complex outermembrane receptor protein